MIAHKNKYSGFQVRNVNLIVFFLFVVCFFFYFKTIFLMKEYFFEEIYSLNKNIVITEMI